MMPETEYLWKILRDDRTTPYSCTRWPVRLGAWTPDRDPVMCESGWHAWRGAAVLGHLRDGELLFLAKGRGERVDRADKSAFTSMKITPVRWDDYAQRMFAADCAEHVLHLFESEHPGDPRPRRAIEVARRFAEGQAMRAELDAAWAAARDAARAAARDAAWAAALAAARAATWDAARDAAWAAARAATWAATWDAARAAARAATWAATWDAARAAEQGWQYHRFLHWTGVEVDA